jgi:peptide-methionine (R)-S-oxide reductase
MNVSNVNIRSIAYCILLLLMVSCTQAQQKNTMQKNPYYSRTAKEKLTLSNEEWKAVLPLDVYQVARLAHTERAFTGKYWDQDIKGTYYCAVCGHPLFKSTAKFASGCGWPSFFETLGKQSVQYKPDHSYGMERIEVLCGRCDSHLGHIFDDGPAPTHKRFCMNSIVLDFEAAQ